MADHTMTRGDTKELLLEIDGEDGTPLDLTTWTVAFTARRSPLDATAVITKTTSSGIIRATQSGATLGQATVMLDPADTSSLPAYSTTLVYDVQLSQGSVRRTTEDGTLTITPDVTTG